MKFTDFWNVTPCSLLYVVGSKCFRPDIQKPCQIENAVRDIQGVSRL